MNSIGGYFELELRQGKEYHKDAIRLNTGRNAFEYILRAKKIKKIFLPYYTCNVILEPIRKVKVEFEFYHINKNLEPIFNYDSLKEADYFLYTNYFGIKDDFIQRLSKKVFHLIIDNAQAFYSKPVYGVDTFYSPRKFFGVPDGGYLYSDTMLAKYLEIDNSKGRFGHLIGRIEGGAEGSYPTFIKNDQKLNNLPIRKMSNITQRLLKNIDYKNVALRRRENFNYLHSVLGKFNELSDIINIEEFNTPMVYPFLKVGEGNIRRELINNKIYVPIYWINVEDWLYHKKNIEMYLYKNLIPLPIDQRYNIKLMDNLLSVLLPLLTK